MNYVNLRIIEFLVILTFLLHSIEFHVVVYIWMLPKLLNNKAFVSLRFTMRKQCKAFKVIFVVLLCAIRSFIIIDTVYQVLRREPYPLLL
jgi:hypothetical protein